MLVRIAVHLDRDEGCEHRLHAAVQVAADTTRTSTSIGVGNAILNAATDHGSDLIVMGAHGHSRLREWVMGGASRTLLETMTVPVLFSH